MVILSDHEAFLGHLVVPCKSPRTSYKFLKSRRKGYKDLTPVLLMSAALGSHQRRTQQ